MDVEERMEFRRSGEGSRPLIVRFADEVRKTELMYWCALAVLGLGGCRDVWRGWRRNGHYARAPRRVHASCPRLLWAVGPGLSSRLRRVGCWRLGIVGRLETGAQSFFGILS